MDSSPEIGVLIRPRAPSQRGEAHITEPAPGAGLFVLYDQLSVHPYLHQPFLSPEENPVRFSVADRFAAGENLQTTAPPDGQRTPSFPE